MSSLKMLELFIKRHLYEFYFSVCVLYLWWPNCEYSVMFLLVLLLMDIWIVSIWEYLEILILWCIFWKTYVLISFGHIPKSSIPGHSVGLFSSLVDTARWFCKVFIPIYTLIRILWVFWWFSFLSSTLYYLSFLF